MPLMKRKGWKIWTTVLLIAGMVLACTHCSVRSLVYLPPQPKDKTAYLQKRAEWEPQGAPSTGKEPVSADGSLKKKDSPFLFTTEATPWTSP